MNIGRCCTWCYTFLTERVRKARVMKKTTPHISTSAKFGSFVGRVLFKTAAYQLHIFMVLLARQSGILTCIVLRNENWNLRILMPHKLHVLHGCHWPNSFTRCIGIDNAFSCTIIEPERWNNKPYWYSYPRINRRPADRTFKKGNF